MTVSEGDKRLHRLKVSLLIGRNIVTKNHRSPVVGIIGARQGHLIPIVNDGYARDGEVVGHVELGFGIRGRIVELGRIIPTYLGIACIV